MSTFNDITMDDINSAADGTDETVTDPVPEPTPEPTPEPEPVQPEVEPEPVAAEPAEPVEPPAPSHPWDADLAFVPDEHRAAVSKYLADQWQPRMTQHEQDLKEWKDAFGGDPEVRDLGSKLINSFQTIGAEGTFLQMGVELGFIDPAELGDEWAEIYQKIEAGGEPGAPPDPTDDSRLTAEEREILDWAKSQKEREFQETQRNELHDYYKGLANEAGIPLDKFDIAKFDVFFGGTVGDEKESIAMYKAWAAGAAPPPPAPEVPPVPVLDDHTGGQAPPEAEYYGNDFKAAGKALMAELQAMEGR